MKRKPLILFFSMILMVLSMPGCNAFKADYPSAIDNKGVIDLSSVNTIGDNTYIELNALNGAIWENGNMVKIFHVITTFKEANPELEVAPSTTMDIIININKDDDKSDKIIKGIWLHHSPRR